MLDENKTKKQLMDELAELRKQIEFYKQILDELPVSTGFYDKSEKLTYKNKAAQFIDVYENRLCTGINKGTVGPSEITYIDKDGSIKDVLLLKNHVCDSNSKTSGTIVCAIDITSYVHEIKQTGEILQEQLHFMQNMIDTIPNPIFFKDINGIYSGCNSAFEKYLGLSKDRIVGSSVYDIYPKDLADKYREMDLMLFSNQGTQIYEIPFIHADGTRHDVILNKATYLNNNVS